MDNWFNFLLAVAVMVLLAFIVHQVGADKTILGMIASGLVSFLGGIKFGQMISENGNKDKGDK